MSNKKEVVTLRNDEILSISNYLASENYWQNNNDKVDAQLSWKIRMNRKELSSALELIKEAESEIMNEYNTDEKSEAVKDNDGNETGDKIVKPEFQQEFINKKQELYSQVQDLNITMVDSSVFFDYSMKDIDWEMMSFMIKEDEDAEEEYNKQEENKNE